MPTRTIKAACSNARKGWCKTVLHPDFQALVYGHGVHTGTIAINLNFSRPLYDTMVKAPYLLVSRLVTSALLVLFQ